MHEYVYHVCIYTNGKYTYITSWLHFTLVIFAGIQHVCLELVLRLTLLKSVHVDST